MAKYKYIFFDLDHTLWDFETNSNHTLKELISKYNIESVTGFVFDDFIKSFHEANYKLWDEFILDKINTEQLRNLRFDYSFAKYDFDKEKIKSQFIEDYLALCPYKGNLIPQAREILEYLYGEYFNLYILTNGFEHIQMIKLTTSGVFHYFEEIFTVNELGFKKPDPRYFKNVLDRIGAEPSECIMIGDSLHIDVLPAMNLGIHGVWYNPTAQSGSLCPTFEIKSLSELKEIIK